MKHIIIIILTLLSITINAQGIRLNSKQSVIDSTRLNATGDSLYYYQNGVLLSTGAIGSGSMITGTGTVNYLPKFTGTKTLGNSLIYDNGTNVGIGTTTPQGDLHIHSSTTESVIQLTNASTGSALSDGLRVATVNNDAFFLLREAANMLFATSNTERMRITSTGNVGIGTTGSNAKLEVAATSGEVFRADANFGAYRIVANQTGVNMNGKVGIGTSSPLATLDISSGYQLGDIKLGGNVDANTRTDDTRKIGRIVGSHYDNNDVDILMFSYDSDGTNNILSFGGGAGALNAATEIGFFTASSPTTRTGSERMHIDNNGYVGIGEINPTEKLHVAGDAYFLNNGITQLQIRTPNSTYDDSFITFGTNVYNRGQIRVSGDAANVGFMTFTTYDNGTPIEGIRITQTGNVGIGDTSPDSKLEVNGSATNTNSINTSSDTINYSLSNIAYTDNTSSNITLTNIKDGGAYTLISTSRNVSTEVSFTVPTGFSIIGMGTVPRTFNKQHIYSFIVAGSIVYVTMGTEN